MVDKIDLEDGSAPVTVGVFIPMYRCEVHLSKYTPEQFQVYEKTTMEDIRKLKIPADDTPGPAVEPNTSGASMINARRLRNINIIALDLRFANLPPPHTSSTMLYLYNKCHQACREGGIKKIKEWADQTLKFCRCIYTVDKLIVINVCFRVEPIKTRKWRVNTVKIHVSQAKSFSWSPPFFCLSP